MNEPDKPVAGFYQTRLVRGGPFVAVRVWFGQPYDPATGEYCDRSYRWRAAIDGEQVDVWRVWPACSGRPISEGEYRYLRTMSAHAKTYEPMMPEASPRKPIDWNRLNITF